MTDEPSTSKPPASAPTATPGWVKVSAVVTIGLIVVVVIVMLVGGGEHGPGRHSGGVPPSSVAGEHAPPAGHAPE
jgi:hypothetical protein